MPDDLWYKDGLRFTCTRCGKCCTGEPGFVWVDDDELARLARHRGDPLHVFTAVYTRTSRGRRTLREKANGDCVFWEAGRGCTVYPVRPKQCRTWPFWESNLESPEQWAEVEAVCPGSGEGELIPVEEITRRVNQIRM
jgi:Fe-S-cluster containining protein